MRTPRLSARGVPMVTSLGSIRSIPAAPDALRTGRDGHVHRLPLVRVLADRLSGVTVLLVTVDVLAFAAAALVAGLGLQWTVVTAGVLLGCRAGTRLYRRRLWLSWFHELPRSLATTAMGLGLLITVALVAGQLDGAAAVPAMVLLFVAFNELPRTGPSGIRAPGSRSRAAGDVTRTSRAALGSGPCRMIPEAP